MSGVPKLALLLILLGSFIGNAHAQNPDVDFERKRLLEVYPIDEKPTPVSEIAFDSLRINSDYIQYIYTKLNQTLADVLPTSVGVIVVDRSWHHKYYWIYTTPAKPPEENAGSNGSASNGSGKPPQSETPPEENKTELTAETELKLKEMWDSYGGVFKVDYPYALDVNGKKHSTFNYRLDKNKNVVTELEQADVLLIDLMSEREVLITESASSDLDDLLYSLLVSDSLREALKYFIWEKKGYDQSLNSPENLAYVKRLFEEELPKIFPTLPTFVPYTIDDYNRIVRAVNKANGSSGGSRSGSSGGAPASTEKTIKF